MFKVAVVEDNEMNRAMVTRRLTKKGYIVIGAADGREAVRIAMAEQPDIILMDLDLPIVSGRTAAREIRGNTSLQNIPIIALTAHPVDSQNAHMADSCWDEYVTKPIDFPALLDKIDQLLAGRRIAKQRLHSVELIR